MTLKLNGWRDMQRVLDRMDDRTERRFAIRAVRSGANYMARQIRKKLPRDPSDDGVHLKKSVRVKQSKEARRRQLTVLQVGYIGQARLYGHIVEYGGVTGGQRAQPVWRPAFKTQASAAIQKMTESLERDLTKELRAGR